MIILPQISVSADRVALDEGDSVLEIARTLVAQGARMLQLRDAEGSLSSVPGTSEWLGELTASLPVPVQFDGALGDSQALERIARLGFDTVVVSQHAIFDPLFLRWAHDLLGARMVVEVQADGEHVYDPPRNSFHVELVEAVRKLRFQGARHILFRDVTGIELPLNRLRYLCTDLGMTVTFAGSVRSVDDLRELTVIDSPNLHAVVIGTPLMDGRIKLAEANRVAG